MEADELDEEMLLCLICAFPFIGEVVTFVTCKQPKKTLIYDLK
jgi:hypothetical protein